MKLVVFVEQEVHVNGEENHYVIAACHPEDECDLQAELDIDAMDQSDVFVDFQVGSFEVPATLDDEEPEDWQSLYVVCEERGPLLTPLHIFDDEEAAQEHAENLGAEESVECTVCLVPMTPIGACQ